MLTLTSPVAISYTIIRLRSFETNDVPSLGMQVETQDSQGNNDSFALRVSQTERQGLRVQNGRLAVYTEAFAGYAAALFTQFVGASGGIGPRLRAIESKLVTDGLLPAGTVS